MSAVNDALQAVLNAKHNAVNLADPEVAYNDAMNAWMQAVTDAVHAVTGMDVPAAVAPTPAQLADPANGTVMTTADFEALAAKVNAGAAAVAAFDAVLHPPVDAAPSSTEPPAIAPSNTGV